MPDRRLQTRKEAAVHKAAKALNEALLRAAEAGLSLHLRAGTGPYRTGPTNSTERWWVTVDTGQ